jgi:dienelactone hydrolase
VVTITATSVAYTPASAAATVTVPAITISIAPGSALLPVNITQQFSASVDNDPGNKGSTWAATQSGTACSPSCGTTVPSTTASGIPTTYTAPAKVPANSTVTIAATSVTDTTKTVSAAITLTAGTVELVPDSLDFGKERVGFSSLPQTATLTNVGSTALSITGINITGADAGNFSETNTCGTSVGAGMSCTITVTFTPNARLSRTATLSVSDTSVDSPQQMSLSGTGFTGAADDRSAVRSALATSGEAAVPSPTGPNNVGTRVLHLVDSTRDNPFLANGTQRELLVRFWYPAPSSQDCERAEYTSPGVWDHFSKLVGVPLPEVTTNSCLNAPMMDGAHPVVVFTHGYTGTFTDYTFIFEDLASRGYIVASVDHTYEATAVQFPDGRFVKSVFGSHLGNTWRGDDKAFSLSLSVRLSDLKFVLNELERLNAGVDGPFSSKLDMSRVALAGHSFGGLTAILGVEQDPRFKVGIVIDGVIPDNSASGSTGTPVFLLAAGREQWSDAERRLWGHLQGPRLAVNLKGAEHVTPTDEVWLATGAIRTCPMGPEKTIAAVRDYIAAFLDANLLDNPVDPLLTGPSSEYPDAEVTTQNQLLRGKP